MVHVAMFPHQLQKQTRVRVGSRGRQTRHQDAHSGPPWVLSLQLIFFRKQMFLNKVQNHLEPHAGTLSSGVCATDCLLQFLQARTTNTTE